MEQSQVHLVAGIRGDIPSLSFGQLNDWRFDTYLSFSHSNGKSDRYGVREDRLNHALGYNSSSSTPCSNDLNNSLAPDVTSDCVPVNMYASSLYPLGRVTGDFATLAERECGDTRHFDTDYEQIIFSLRFGNVLNLPAGGMALGVGFEARRDEIKSKARCSCREWTILGLLRR